MALSGKRKRGEPLPLYDGRSHFMVINLKEYLGRLETPEHFFLLRYVFGTIASANDKGDRISTMPHNPYEKRDSVQTVEMDEFAKGYIGPSDTFNSYLDMKCESRTISRELWYGNHRESINANKSHTKVYMLNLFRYQVHFFNAIAECKLQELQRGREVNPACVEAATVEDFRQLKCKHLVFFVQARRLSMLNRLFHTTKDELVKFAFETKGSRVVYERPVTVPAPPKPTSDEGTGEKTSEIVTFDVLAPSTEPDVQKYESHLEKGYDDVPDRSLSIEEKMAHADHLCAIIFFRLRRRLREKTKYVGTRWLQLTRRNLWFHSYKIVFFRLVSVDALSRPGLDAVASALLDVRKCLPVDHLTVTFKVGCYTHIDEDEVARRLGMTAGRYSFEAFLRQLRRHVTRIENKVRKNSEDEALAAEAKEARQYLDSVLTECGENDEINEDDDDGTVDSNGGSAIDSASCDSECDDDYSYGNYESVSPMECDDSVCLDGGIDSDSNAGHASTVPSAVSFVNLDLTATTPLLPDRATVLHDPDPPAMATSPPVVDSDGAFPVDTAPGKNNCYKTRMSCHFRTALWIGSFFSTLYGQQPRKEVDVPDVLKQGVRGFYEGLKIRALLVRSPNFVDDLPKALIFGGSSDWLESADVKTQRYADTCQDEHVLSHLMGPDQDANWSFERWRMWGGNFQRKKKLRAVQIKQGKWSAEEDAELTNLHAEHGNSWTLISEQMNSGRTGPQCRQRWKISLSKNASGQWTAEEDAELTNLHAEHGNSWTLISEQMNSGRTGPQCLQRWQTLVKEVTVPRSVPAKKKLRAVQIKQGKWSAEEDAELTNLHAEHGNSWTLISEQMNSGRTGPQCRQRWKNSLSKTVSGNWTAEEDAELTRLHTEHGNSWTLISEQMNSGRTGPQCLQRWKKEAFSKKVSAQR